MLNLLIREDRYKIRREYLNRVFNVFLILTLVLIIIYGLFSYSNFILARAQSEIIGNEVQKINNSMVSKEYQEYKDIVTDLEARYSQLGRGDKILSSEYIDLILGLTSRSIKLNFVNVVFGENENVSVDIRGVANTRESLQDFVSLIEGLDQVESVDVPISNFVQNSDLNFSAKIIFKNQNENGNE